jgi:hypothetical protein
LKKAITSPRKVKNPANRLKSTPVNFEGMSILYAIAKHLDQHKTVDALKADVAVLASHVQRLTNEVAIRDRIIAQLERSQGVVSANTEWDERAQSWRVIA